MKKLLLLTFAVFFSWAVYSQASLYYDDFESYTVGEFIAASNSTWWTTWSNLPGSAEDGEISNAHSSSPTKSILVDKVPAETDLILKLGNKASGAYELNWEMYIETANGGYYNVQHFESPGIEWAYEVYFLANGSGELYAGSTTPIAFTYPKNAWFLVENLINIDEDLVTLVVNGVEVSSWPFHYQADATTGTNQLGGVDFFAGAKTGETPKYYFDNLDFKPMPTTLYADDFDSYTAGEYIAVVNPTWWTTWSNLPGSAEDGPIVSEQSSSAPNSILIDKVPAESDLILKLGNKNAGNYDLSWKMYVPTGNAGYFNVQHFESPGIEWAYEVYFLADGTGELYAGSTTPFTFTYPHNIWFVVDNQINIDEDQVTLVINGVEVLSWPFHYQGGETTGTNQLGGVDFFAGAVTGETPKYFFDDLEFVQYGSATAPSIAVDPTEIEATTAVGTTTSVPVVITNNGTADLTYNVSVFYPAPPGQNAPVTTLDNQESGVRTMSYVTGNSTDPNYKPAPYNPPTDDFQLHYDGNNANSFSWGPNAPYTIVNAAMFPPSLTMPQAGTMLTKVEMYFNELGTNFRLRIYGAGNGYKPGEMLVDQPFTPAAATWTIVQLSTPVYITGEELWVGYQYTQPDSAMYIPGVDAGPNNINGDWISFSGVSWQHLTDYGDNVNWNIRADLVGTPITKWLSAAPTSGTVAPGESATVNVTCDATDLEVGTYYGAVRILSNDNENPQIDVPVTFEVTEGGTMNSIILDFEAQEDWSLTFDPWTVNDVDGCITYPIDQVTFPHSGEAMAYIAFNPATTTPPITDPDMQPHGGVRFGACMAAADPNFQNDDWLISPPVALGMNSSLTFWAKSYTDAYGLERYNVLVSTTDNDPASFASISGPTYLEAPLDWTEMYYDLSAYDGQTIYVAIQCVSADAFIFMVDDISIDYYVGTSEPEQVTFTMYPNPVTDQLNISSNINMTEVEIFNQLGQKVYSQVVKDNIFNLKTNGYEAGVYYVRITTDQGISTEKFMIK